MAIGTAGDWKVLDEFKNWAGHKSMVAKRQNGGGGGGGGGGGDAPNWVPANAKIYIDLVNNRAWTEADGEVAIVGGVLKFDDADWGLADTANIVPGSGLRATLGQASFPRFDDATQAALLTSGLTLVADYDYANGGGSAGMTFDFELYSADFNVNVFGTERDTSGVIGDGNISDNTIAGPGAVDGRYKFAVTMLAAGGIAASFNNGSVHTVATETPLSALHYVGFSANVGTLVEGNYLRTVTVYTPRPDADLPALSG